MKKRTKKTFVAILILTMLFSWVMEKMDAIATYVSDCWDGEWMWDLDETGPNSNLPDNTVLHMDRILEGDIMFHGNSKEEFYGILKKNMQPVYESAKRQGYEVWNMRK